MKINLRLLCIYLAKIYPWYNLTSIIKFLVHRAHALSYGTQFFHFCTHFHQKAPALEVHLPLMGAPLPTGNPGSATGNYVLFLVWSYNSQGSYFPF